MIRERIAVAYPGRTRIGLSLWVMEDGTIRRAAVGAPPTSAVAGVLARFQPALLVLEAGRPTGASPARFRANAERLEFAHPAWRTRSLRQPYAGVGFLAQNAWRMGFSHLIRRGHYRVGALTPERLTSAWLERHSPPRRDRAGRP